MIDKDAVICEIRVDKDGWTGNLQVNICVPESGGYRLAGPKYNGSSENLLKRRLNQRDADTIRSMLDEAFPPKEKK